jgi:hypothetical protein
LAAKEGAMCGFAYSLIDLEGLDPKKRKHLLKELQQRKKALEAERKGIDESLENVNKALKAALKPKRK